MRTRKTIFVSGLALLALSLVISTSAVAQTDEGYNPVGPTTLNEVEEGGGPGPGGATNARSGGGNASGPANTSADETQSAGEGGNLPFTGLDVILLLAAGGVLALMGFGMRRLTRSTPAA